MKRVEKKRMAEITIVIEGEDNTSRERSGRRGGIEEGWRKRGR